MNFISESSETSPLNLVGGKGSHLQKLRKWKAPVPPFFIVTTEAFDYYRRENKLPDKLGKRFKEFFKYHPLIALRSSMIAEDTSSASFAGLFETLLDVTMWNWEPSLLKIFNSLSSPRVLEYVQRKQITLELKMAVVAQAVVKVEKSGVLFTRAPVTPTAVIAIDAAFGMGEGVVSGNAVVDSYQITRTKELVRADVVNKPQVLSEEELHKLADMGLQLEAEAGFPSDIEWGYKNGELVVFQIRPITREFEPLEYFVDTNLSESYPGVVSPFTGAFVKKAYENVFKESALLLGAGRRRYETLSFHYAKLISCVDDHLYYNLEHYYAVLRALPGGDKNITNWHKMIGGKIEESIVPYHATRLSAFESVISLLSLAKLALFRKSICWKFLRDLEDLKKEIEGRSIELATPEEIIRYVNALLDRRLGFGLTVVNDVFIMIGLGMLTKALKKSGVSEDTVIDLLKTEGGVDSTKPLEHFNELLNNLSPKFLDTFEAQEFIPGPDPYRSTFEALSAEGFTEDVMRLERFLQLYGDRSFEELRLESLPLINNPPLLQDLMKWARKNPPSSQPFKEPQVPAVTLSWYHRKILNFTRDAIKMREATRLWRGKFYHLLRQLVLKLSVQIRSSDPSWETCSVADFFSLSPTEWLEYADGKMTMADVQALIEARRAWQSKKKQFPELILWVASEPLPEIETQEETGTLKGQGVSPGETEGTVLVLENPQEALGVDFSDFILVTRNTDPAWVYIMSRSKGLISEKGSLLSHTAIIGRELHIPTIVGVRHATQRLKTGDRIRIDAHKGTIEVL